MSNYSPCFVDGFTINYSSGFGNGAFSTCYRCSNPKYQSPLCVKIISFTSKTQITFGREIEILQKLSKVDCNNLVKILHLSQLKNQCYIFMEYCLQGDFQNIIKQREKMKIQYKVEEILSILGQLINGYKYLYDFGIIHRDIKPANIFLGNNGCFQLGDYGLSKILDNPNLEIAQSNAGTPFYAAPQMLIEGIYSNKCDIYSLGVIVYELVYSQIPINSNSLLSFVEAVKKSKYNKIIIRNIPNSLGGTQSQQQKLLNFLNSSLVYEESNRISWEELFQQFSDVNISSNSIKENYQTNSNSFQQSTYVSSQSKPQSDPNLQESISIDNNNKNNYNNNFDNNNNYNNNNNNNDNNNNIINNNNNDNISQSIQTQFLRSNTQLKKANKTGEFTQIYQESYDNSKFQAFHSEQLLMNRLDQQQCVPQLKKFKFQKKSSICENISYDHVLEKILDFYQAKCTFVNKLINQVENSFKFLEQNQLKRQQSLYTITLNLLQLYLYGYQYSSYFNIYYLLFKRYLTPNELQILKELSWVDKKCLEEEISGYLKNQPNLKISIQQQYKFFKQKFNIEMNRFQQYQKQITDPQFLQEINEFNFKESIFSPKLYYIQYKKMFKEMYLNFDFNAEYSYLEDHTIKFLAFSIKFIKNEEINKDKFQCQEDDKQQIIELQENKRFLLKTIQQYFQD